MESKLSRRDFFKLQAKNGLFLTTAISGFFWPKLGFTSGLPDIGVARGQTEAATRAAVDLIGGMKRFVKKGQRVLIKPNMSFARSPAQASNTHPEVVRTVAAMCMEAGASSVLILDHTLAPGKVCVQTSGIGPACETIGRNMVHTLNNPSFYKEVGNFKGKEPDQNRCGHGSPQGGRADCCACCKVPFRHRGQPVRERNDGIDL